MTQLDETLSAFLDGECSSAELDRVLEACGRDAALMQRCTRVYASRDAVRGVAVKFDADALCRGVMAQVAPPRRAKVVALRKRAADVVRPLTGLAMAASLGALVTFAALHYDLAPGPVPMATAQATNGNATAQVAQASVPQITAAPAEEVRWSKLDPAAARQLDDYMMEHASYRSGQSMGSALNYARMAAQSNPFAPADGAP